MPPVYSKWEVIISVIQSLARSTASSHDCCYLLIKSRCVPLDLSFAQNQIVLEIGHLHKTFHSTMTSFCLEYIIPEPSKIFLTSKMSILNSHIYLFEYYVYICITLASKRLSSVFGSRKPTALYGVETFWKFLTLFRLLS